MRARRLRDIEVESGGHGSVASQQRQANLRRNFTGPLRQGRLAGLPRCAQAFYDFDARQHGRTDDDAKHTIEQTGY